MTESLHRLLVGRVERRRHGAAGPPGGVARSSAGNAVAVDRFERPARPAAAKSQAAATRSSRCGQASASAIGSLMSGGLAWAIVEPSTKVTIEWITDCGCTTTSIRSYGMPNSRCASITSRPLFTRVAELMVTTGPIAQVGCASACAAVTSAIWSARAAAERAAGCGDHQPGDLGRRAAAQALGQRAVLGVDRHDLPGRGRAGHQRAAGDQRLLVGQRQRSGRRAARPASAPGRSTR